MGFDLDDIGEFIEDVAKVPGKVVEAAGSMFDGPGGIAGIFVSGAAIYVGGPGALVPALVAGVAAKEGINALIASRGLTSEEKTIAEMVFGESIPYDKVRLTNLFHPQGRAFTIPNPAGQYLINLGHKFTDPLAPEEAYPERGQLLIHELTHAWQIHHEHFVPGLICEAIVLQVRNEFEDEIYNPGGGGNPWGDYNLEQQGTLIDHWYMGGCREDHPYYRYVLEINGKKPEALRTMSARGIANRKFGVRQEFSIRRQFPLYKSTLELFSKWNGSLRKSLIGLRGI